MFEERARRTSAYRSVRYSTVRKQSFTSDMNRISDYHISNKKNNIDESTLLNTKTYDFKNLSTYKPFNHEKIPYM